MRTFRYTSTLIGSNTSLATPSIAGIQTTTNRMVMMLRSIIGVDTGVTDGNFATGPNKTSASENDYQLLSFFIALMPSRTQIQDRRHCQVQRFPVR